MLANIGSAIFVFFISSSELMHPIQFIFSSYASFGLVLFMNLGWAISNMIYPHPRKTNNSSSWRRCSWPLGSLFRPDFSTYFSNQSLVWSILTGTSVIQFCFPVQRNVLCYDLFQREGTTGSVCLAAYSYSMCCYLLFRLHSLRCTSDHTRSIIAV